MQLADGLDFGRATEDIKEVVEWTKSNGSSKVGIRPFLSEAAILSNLWRPDNHPAPCIRDTSRTCLMHGGRHAEAYEV